MSSKRSWGADPGTANLGAVLVEGARPLVIIDVVTRPATKGRAATKHKPARPVLPKRLQVRVWVLRDCLAFDVDLESELYDAADAFVTALDWLRGQDLAWGGDVAAVERVIGNVSPDLADVAGIVVGQLWMWSVVERPKRPSAATWRRRMLDIPGNTPAAVAERVALERVREEVPDWPATASGHAAEAYWIARWGAEVCDGK